ncbi:MAG: TlpA family protein disulfide reductase [Marmoricola sp.]
MILGVVVLLALSGCSTTPAEPGAPHVDVDTPALRALKKEAGIEPCPATSADPAQGGLPDVSLPCLGGGTAVDPARLRGPMVVNLFAQWCHPCRKELPYYQAFSRKHAGHVAVLGVDWQDFQPDLALRLAQQAGVTYPLVADPAERIRAVGNALPQLVLLDAGGRVVHQEAVQIKSEQQLEDLVGKYLHP